MHEHRARSAMDHELSRRAWLLIGMAGLAGCAGEDPADDETDETPANGDDTTDGGDDDGSDGTPTNGDATDDDTMNTATNGDDPTEGVQPDDDALLGAVDTFWDALVTGDRATADDVVGTESPLREASWWDDAWEDLTELGIEVAVLDREIVEGTDDRYVVQQRAEWDVPGEPPGIGTDEFTLRVEDESVVVWAFEEEGWEEVEEDEPSRLIALEVADELADDLALEPAGTISADSLMRVDGVPTLVLDPVGEPLYNAAARTRFDAFLEITNEGKTSIDRLVRTLSVTGTANDDAHEAAIGFIRAGDVVPLDGVANLLEDSLDPSETATTGLELDLMDSGISDIEAGATMAIELRRD